MNRSVLMASLGASIILSACAPQSPPAVSIAPPSDKVWARADGQKMAGNPALMQQGQIDLSQCRAASAVANYPGNYNLNMLSNCMISRGYVERPKTESASLQTECVRMGFQPGSDAFSNCQLSLRQVQIQAESYNRAQAEYAAQLQAIKQQQNVDRNLALMQLGLGMAAGGRVSAMPSARATPTLPLPPSPVSIISPSGNRYNCNYVGASVQCR